ncbi:MAG: diguanylate cyclase [Oscillospiraceae bacterium]|nr:diguanylate cyclase [Oscillospiraceae bacterium]
MLINRQAMPQMEELLGDILDAQNADMLVVRGDDCKILFMSSAAREHLEEERLSTRSCKEGYAKIFHGLCKRCPNNPKQARPGQTSVDYDVTGEDGNIVAVTGTHVKWTDKIVATALFLRDVDELRTMQNKMYSLAYKDQLTGMPNRQKLLEDSEVITTARGKNICGTIAMLDLDNFKIVNDTYGHNTGDIMLKRLTEHLNSDPLFNGRLYRLGGDEFVLFYLDDASIFDNANEEELQKYYGEKLKHAFFSYTLPNIDMACTVSMGVAFFPLHGTTISEMLRKADIALYKSKQNGRNRMTFFEDSLEKSKKFKNFYINIQPILTSSGNTFGYELIDSGNENEHGEKSVNLNELDRSIDALGLDDIDNDSRYFIAYTPRIQNKSTLKNLPKDKFIMQINLPLEIKQKDLLTYKTLRSHGFFLSFSGLTEKNVSPEILELADYCRFEPGKVSISAQKELISSHRSIKFIATGIDTNSDYDKAKGLGYKYFQGLFFDHPVVVHKTKDIEPLKLNYLRLLKLTSTDDYVDFSQISDVIASDVALSYKLLRLLNSAAVGLRNRMTSIPMAVSYLGEENLKKWIALLSVRGVAQDKPLELVRISLIRAEFGELLARHMKPPREKKYAFMVGMFSLLHIAMDKSKEELLEEIPVADAIKESILTSNGPYSDLLKFFDDYERSNWEDVTEFAEKNHLSNQVIYESYISAVKWYNGLISGDTE